jgi:RNA polymerase sigma-70 factor (ECF subfamily)
MLRTAQSLADLMERVAARDRPAFAELYQASSAKLYGIILRILQRRAVADEILQEVYVKIWERAADFDRSRASPITWMATIARNRALDEARRGASVALDDLPEADEHPAPAEDPLAGRERSEDLARLMRCLQGLDPDKRKLVLLAYYRGLSREALGKKFAVPTSTIKTWLHRSLAQVRTCLEE